MKTPIEFDSCATNIARNQDCLLFFAISGSPQTIKEKLLTMVRQIDSSYGKPAQGIVSGFGYDSHVITPIWNGEKY